MKQLWRVSTMFHVNRCVEVEGVEASSREYTVVPSAMLGREQMTWRCVRLSHSHCPGMHQFVLNGQRFHSIEDVQVTVTWTVTSILANEFQKAIANWQTLYYRRTMVLSWKLLRFINNMSVSRWLSGWNTKLSQWKLGGELSSCLEVGY